MKEETDAWLTPTQAALVVKMSPAWVRWMANEGRLRSHRKPFGRLIDPDDLARVAAERQKQARGEEHL